MRRLRYALAALLAVAALLAAAPPPARAQRPAKVPRIGYLLLGPLSAEPSPERAAFLTGLRELGYVPGRNLEIEYRSASLRPEMLPDLARELVDLKVDVIVVIGTQGVEVAREVSRTVPVVFLTVADPVGAGFVASLARPGGNLTGQTFMSPELGGKRLALLKEAFPRISRVAVLWNPDNPSCVLEWKLTEPAARRLGLTLRPVELRRAPDLDRALADVAREKPDALVTIPDPLSSSVRTFIIEFAARHRVPAIYGFREFVETGGLLFYGANIPESFRRAAAQVDKILRGARPGVIPVEQPTKFEMVVNLKTARALRFTLPQSLLFQADRVIE